MQLHYNIASPFVRKVMALAIETGLQSQIEPVKRVMTPVTPDADLCDDNPLGKIPCLLTDDGMALYDSRVVCEYLDGLHDGPKMIPASGPERWNVLQRQALADGIMDAAVITRYETFLRPPERRWDEWIDNQLLKVDRALDLLEREAASLSGVDLGTIALACALGYLDFRFPERDWRAGRPQLAAWFETFAARPSIAETGPG
ncbi:MAG: glutathione S-transferase N-terminal domain-containing protein [Pseudomonadota bacterium]